MKNPPLTLSFIDHYCSSSMILTFIPIILFQIDEIACVVVHA